MWGKIMNYIYDYISEERKKEIADMNIHISVQGI